MCSYVYSYIITVFLQTDFLTPSSYVILVLYLRLVDGEPELKSSVCPPPTSSGTPPGFSAGLTATSRWRSTLNPHNMFLHMLSSAPPLSITMEKRINTIIII